MLNVALIEAFGISIDKKKGKNNQARCVIDGVKKCIEHINKSSGSKVWWSRLDSVLLFR